MFSDFSGRIVRERWCFGGICPESQEGFLVFVERRDAATLEAHIEDNILPGTIVHSDGWAAYSGYVFRFFCFYLQGYSVFMTLITKPFEVEEVISS